MLCLCLPLSPAGPVLILRLLFFSFWERWGVICMLSPLFVWIWKVFGRVYTVYRGTVSCGIVSKRLARARFDFSSATENHLWRWYTLLKNNDPCCTNTKCCGQCLDWEKKEVPYGGLFLRLYTLWNESVHHSNSGHCGRLFFLEDRYTNIDEGSTEVQRLALQPHSFSLIFLWTFGCSPHTHIPMSHIVCTLTSFTYLLKMKE